MTGLRIDRNQCVGCGICAKTCAFGAVSYTHLDVYKRQSMYCVMILPMAAAFVFFLFNRKRLLQKSGRGKGSLSR